MQNKATDRFFFSLFYMMHHKFTINNVEPSLVAFSI